MDDRAIQRLAAEATVRAHPEWLPLALDDDGFRANASEELLGAYGKELYRQMKAAGLSIGDLMKRYQEETGNPSPLDTKDPDGR